MRTSHSYFVMMIQYPRHVRADGSIQPACQEAVVNPEHTRRDIVALLKSGEAKHVAFIHHVDGLYIEDVTDELFEEAEADLRASPLSPADIQAAQFDHARELRKEVA